MNPTIDRLITAEEARDQNRKLAMRLVGIALFLIAVSIVTILVKN